MEKMVARNQRLSMLFSERMHEAVQHAPMISAECTRKAVASIPIIRARLNLSKKRDILREKEEEHQPQ